MWQTVPMAGQRARARAAVIADIATEARRQMATDGAAGLSLRSVARELGMVSSGIYRYVDSRDSLLTMLLVSCYDEFGASIEAAVAATDPESARIVRWRAACDAVRSWALDHPHDYALLYGSPVPGYAAPEDTIGPARRVYAALAAPLRGLSPDRVPSAPSAGLRGDGSQIAAVLDLDVSPDTALAFVRACAGVFGLISLELFGHTHNVIADTGVFFAHHVDRLAFELGIPGAG